MVLAAVFVIVNATALVDAGLPTVSVAVTLKLYTWSAPLSLVAPYVSVALNVTAPVVLSMLNRPLSVPDKP